MACDSNKIHKTLIKGYKYRNKISIRINLLLRKQSQPIITGIYNCL